MRPVDVDQKIVSLADHNLFVFKGVIRPSLQNINEFKETVTVRGCGYVMVAQLQKNAVLQDFFGALFHVCHNYPPPGLKFRQKIKKSNLDLL